jgi:endonuclease YncB( thermonuclease family)
MKRIFKPLTFVLFFIPFQMLLSNRSFAEFRDLVSIENCYDGDTCRTTSGERIRLACIDAPEIRGHTADHARAVAARDRLEMLVVGKSVSLRRITKDRFGRTVGELFVDGGNVQQMMVSSRHAVVHPRYAHQCPWAE